MYLNVTNAASELTRNRAHILELIKKDTPSTEEVMTIFQYYKNTGDSDVFDALVAKNENLVYYTLSKYSNRADFEDILQEGRIGLISAVKKYDPSLGYAFSTLACRYIWGYAIRYIDGSSIIRIPNDVMADIKRLKYYISNHPKETPEEIAVGMKFKLDKVKELMMYEANTVVASLDVPVSAEMDGQLLVDLIEDSKESGYRQIERRETDASIMELVSELIPNEKHVEILKRYFGIDCAPMCGRLIAKEMGLSYQYIHATITRTLRKLKQRPAITILRNRLGIPKDVPVTSIASYLAHE